VNSPFQRDDGEGWRAELELGFLRSGDRTVLARRRHVGPLAVQRPFYPEGALCHVYLLHPPGGVVAGDRLGIGITADAGAEALVTTPAAGKFYRSDGRLARQSVRVSVGEGGSLEWLPQETIVYEGARVASDVRVELAAGARFMGWDVFSLGRPASGEGFRTGEVRLGWQLRCAEQPLYLDRLHLDRRAFQARWGLSGLSACGTLFACPASERDLAAVRELMGETEGLGVTRIEDLLICRALGHGTGAVMLLFQQIRDAIRTGVIGRGACAPRIWAT
jgi:urease accessory protein